MINNYIINPKTNRKVRVNTKLGQNILRNYVMNGGKPWSNLFGLLSQESSSPPRPKTIAFLNSPKGKALFKQLKEKGIKCCWDNYSTFEDLVQLLNKAGVKDDAGNPITPKTWEDDWNAKKLKKKVKRDKKILVLNGARTVLDDLYSEAFKDKLKSMKEPLRSSEANTREKALSKALKTHNKLYNDAYPDAMIFNDSKYVDVIKELKELANPIKIESPGKKKESPKKKSPKKKSPKKKSPKKEWKTPEPIFVAVSSTTMARPPHRPKRKQKGKVMNR